MRCRRHSVGLPCRRRSLGLHWKTRRWKGTGGCRGTGRLQMRRCCVGSGIGFLVLGYFLFHLPAAGRDSLSEARTGETFVR